MSTHSSTVLTDPLGALRGRLGQVRSTDARLRPRWTLRDVQMIERVLAELDELRAAPPVVIEELVRPALRSVPDNDQPPSARLAWSTRPLNNGSGGVALVTPEGRDSGRVYNGTDAHERAEREAERRTRGAH